MDKKKDLFMFLPVSILGCKNMLSHRRVFRRPWMLRLYMAFLTKTRCGVRFWMSIQTTLQKILGRHTSDVGYWYAGTV